MIPDLAVVPVVPVVPVVSYKPPQAPQPNFLSEGVRLGLDKEIAPDGTYLAYFPFGAMIERSRMTSYRKKLFLVRRAPSATLGEKRLSNKFCGQPPLF